MMNSRSQVLFIIGGVSGSMRNELSCNQHHRQQGDITHQLLLIMPTDTTNSNPDFIDPVHVALGNFDRSTATGVPDFLRPRTQTLQLNQESTTTQAPAPRQNEAANKQPSPSSAPVSKVNGAPTYGTPNVWPGPQGGPGRYNGHPVIYGPQGGSPIKSAATDTVGAAAGKLTQKLPGLWGATITVGSKLISNYLLQNGQTITGVPKTNLSPQPQTPMRYSGGRGH